MSVRFGVDRRALSLVALALCVLAGALALASAPALANTAHVYSASFGKAGSGAGELALGGTASGVAVNEETHNVYVADAGNHRVDEFSAAGVFIRAFGANVGGAGIDVCTTSCVAGASASSPGALEEPTFIAIDNDPLSASHGDVYVGDRGDDLVTKFTAEGTLESAWGTDGQLNGSAAEDGPFDELDGIALNSSGYLFVYDKNNDWFKFASNDAAEPTIKIGRGTSPVGIGVDGAGNFYKILGYEVLVEFSSAGEQLLEYENFEGVTAFAIESRTNDIYLVQGSEVARLNGEALLERFGSAHLTQGAGVAVDATTETVYVADSAKDEIAAFVPGVIESESTSLDEAQAVTLEATINPDGTETSYHFEYGPAAGVYDVSVPVPARTIAAVRSSVEVSARATGLSPGTTYHYRVVVTSNGLPVAVDGPDQTFTTLTPQGTGSPANCSNEQRRAEQPYGLQLPDCRAYELVSPLDNEGAELEAGLGRAAVSGDAATYDSQVSADKPSGALLLSWYLSRRGPTGWTTQNVTPPYRATVQANTFAPFVEKLFTPELTKGVFIEPDSLLSREVPSGYWDLFLANFAEGSYQTVTSVVPPGVEPYHEELEEIPTAEGASADLSHIAFEQEASLTPGASPGKTHIYVWVEATHKIYQVDVAPGGTTFSGKDILGSGGARLWHAVSGDGLRIFFTAGSNGQLYARENPEQEQSPESESKCTVPTDACTVDVSTSERSMPDSYGPQPATFQEASANGARVFFTSTAELTEDANTGSADNAPNLYEYDFEAPEGKRLTDLTVTAEANGARVDGVADISEEGSYVYFVAEGELASNENSHGSKAEAGKPNLYLDHEGTMTFIATLSSEDRYGQLSGFNNGSNGSRVSADGTHFAFMSERSLTGYDNQPVEPKEECGPEGCPEVYLYDATSESLVCASCNPSGAQPAHTSRFEHDTFDDGESLVPPRNLSEDGARLFFDSREPLLPQASNGLENVYEYENGHLYLISDGSGAYDSTFMEASPSGDDVFFITADGLLPEVRDQRTNVYDARVGGGFTVPATAPACDNADSCHGPESAQPAVFGAPASATFSGAGNPPPSPPPASPTKSTTKTVKCKKGEVRKHGKCVEPSKTKKRAKKSAHGKRRSK